MASILAYTGLLILFEKDKEAGFQRYTVHYYNKANMLDGFISITFFRSILQTACCETESKTVCYTATSWFPMVSASCTIDTTETSKCFHLMENAFTKICDASVIKQTCSKRNEFGFPLTFSYRVNKKRNMAFPMLRSGKTLNALCLFCFSYMIRARILINAYPIKYFRNLRGTQAYLKPCHMTECFELLQHPR